MAPSNLASIHEERIQSLEERVQKQAITDVQLDAKFEALSNDIKDLSVNISNLSKGLNDKLDCIKTEIKELKEKTESHSDFIKNEEQKATVSKKHRKMALTIFSFFALPTIGAVLGKFGDSIFAFLTK